MGKILITGGAGFIGNAFARYAHACGLEIVVFDNLSSSQRSCFEELINLGIDCVEGDIRDSVIVSKLLRDCHSVVHLAAKVSVSESIKNPKDTMDVNINGTQTLIDEIRGRGFLIGLKIKVNQIKFIERLISNKMLTIRAAENVVRILPPLNVNKKEIDLAILILDKVCKTF